MPPRNMSAKQDCEGQGRKGSGDHPPEVGKLVNTSLRQAQAIDFVVMDSKTIFFGKNWRVSPFMFSLYVSSCVLSGSPG